MYFSVIQREVTALSIVRHKNLVTYICSACIKKKEGLLVQIVQEFVLGASIKSLNSVVCFNKDKISSMAKTILEMLVLLHSKGIVHNSFGESNVFIDSQGIVRIANFSLFSYLRGLHEGNKLFKSDLVALGELVESLLKTKCNLSQNFIEMCKSARTIAATDLKDHPFLNLSAKDKCMYETANNLVEENRKILSPIASSESAQLKKSRLHDEFEILAYLGKGAYGDVLKVRKVLDNRQYAIKRIPLPVQSKQIFRKMTREVELLSRLNHENVVRYYNSWIETGIHLNDFERNFVAIDISFSDNGKQSNQFSRVIRESESNESSDWMNM